MGNQMATSEIRKYFHARFVKILITSRNFIITGVIVILIQQEC